jgi:HK97 family phage prohead protease
MSQVRNLPPEARAVLGGLEVRDIDGRHLVAVVTTFDSWEDVGPYEERMAPTVFDTSLARTPGIPLLVGHQRDGAAVGKAVDWIKGTAELRGVFRFGSHTQAQAVADEAADEMYGGVSVGFYPGRKPGDSEWSHDRTRVTRHHARLGEVSLVTVPANQDARILAVRTLGAPDPERHVNRREAEQILARLRASAVDLRDLL